MDKISSNRFPASSSDNRKSKSGPADGNLKWLGLSVIAFVLALSGAVAQAQQPTKIPRIGYLSSYLPFRFTSPHRGIPARSTRACIRGGEKHCH